MTNSDFHRSADIVELAGIWAGRAEYHELAAREMEAYGDDRDDDELALHREVAATLRQCIQELLHPEPKHHEVEEPVF